MCSKKVEWKRSNFITGYAIFGNSKKLMVLSSESEHDRGIIITKEEMLKSLKSYFEHMITVIATLLGLRFKATFYDVSAIQTLAKLCGPESSESLNNIARS